MAVKINFDQKVKFWRFVHHEASAVNIDRMSGDYNQAVQKLIKPKAKETDDGIAEEQVSRDFESLYPENYTEADVSRIRKKAELIQTVQGMKNLAYDNNILFWFSNHGQGLSDRSLVVSVSPGDTSRVAKQPAPTTRPGSPNKSKNLGNFTLQPMATTQTHEAVLVAWAKLDMNGVDSSDAIEAFISAVQTPSMASVVSPNKSRNSMNLDSSEKPKGQRSANNFKTFESKGKYFLKIHAGHNPEDEIVEVLFFESRDKLEEWREWMAKVPVCFLDLKHRYEFIQHRGRDGPYRIAQVKCRRSGEFRAARIVDCFSNATGGTLSHRMLGDNLQRVFGEIQILNKLQGTGYAQQFFELFIFSGQLWAIVSFVDGEHLGDWLSRLNTKPMDDPLVVESLLEVILGLLHIVKSLVRNKILHGNISKENVLIKVCSCPGCMQKGTANKIGLASQISQDASKNLGQDGFVKFSQQAQNLFEIIDPHEHYHPPLSFCLTNFSTSKVYNTKSLARTDGFQENPTLLSMSHNTSFHFKPIQQLKEGLVRRYVNPEHEDIYALGKIIFEM